MKSLVLTVAPDHTLEEGAAAMIERKVGSAVVLSGASLVGIVTERDVMRAVARGMVPWNTRIEDVMTADPVSVPPDMATRDAIALMLKGGFRHLPVVKEGQVVGVVSIRDLLSPAEPTPKPPTEGSETP
ncbi:MAG: CBS domain-containing protein [Actinomycetota bacterium]